MLAVSDTASEVADVKWCGFNILSCVGRKHSQVQKLREPNK